MKNLSKAVIRRNVTQMCRTSSLYRREIKLSFYEIRRRYIACTLTKNRQYC